MTVNGGAVKPVDCWRRYAPSQAAPWSRQRVGHLHRRAGFAAAWPEIERDLQDGPEKSVDRLLKGEARTVGVPRDFDHIAGLLSQAAVASRSPARLKAWWVYRMLLGGDPLSERIALLWHNHFATSNLKVQDVSLMHHQNELFRRLGRGPFGELLQEVVKDPTMLIWLDAAANRKEHPNENLAREVMELFTLGEGNYQEKDIKEAARALTGWSVKRNAFHFTAQHHDEQVKTILGRTGKWRGDDLLDILLAQPATATRLARRLCEMFMAEGVVDDKKIAALAAGLREKKLDIDWGIETVLRSEEFFAAANLRRRILAPIPFVIGAARLLEMFDPPPSTLVLSEWSAKMGQDLFYPPNVFGWPGGRAWITTRSMLARANFASALVSGAFRRDNQPLEALKLAQSHQQAANIEQVFDFYSQLIIGAQPTSQMRESILKPLGASPALTEEIARKIVTGILTCPQAQIA